MTRKDFMKLVNKAKLGPHEEYSDLPGLDYALSSFRDYLQLIHHDPKARFFMSEGVMIAIIRYQAMMLNGEWDFNELDHLCWLFKGIDWVN